MRAGLSTIQQTLSPAASAALTRSIADASHRGHAQTTPLHVAAALLATPSGGVLRQACLRSHPASSHPLQCRALELCFSVALDRLPTSAAGGSPAEPPPLSNALLAALKRAQAHQRRGCPEQQQQPLLAIKVELDQLVVSILDDPGVSRVMREARFSSPAVKSAIEHSLSSPSPSPPAARNVYISSRLYSQPAAAAAAGGSGQKDEAQRVLDIMARPKKRNPILVADADPAGVVREVLQRIDAGADGAPASHVIPLKKDVTVTTDRNRIADKIRELGSAVEALIGDGRGVVLDVGDLKWLVEGGGSSIESGPILPQQQQQQQVVSEMGRAAVAEMAKLLQRFARDGGRMWLVGTATCATYLRCQVYHPTMESEWDLQALSIAPPRSPAPGLFPRFGGNGILSSSVSSLSPVKGFPPLQRAPERPESPSKTTLCATCKQSYERELATLIAKPEPRQGLPHWLATAEQQQSKEQELELKQKTEELLKRCREECSRLHPTHSPVPHVQPFPLQTKLMIPQSVDQAGNQRIGLPPTMQRRPGILPVETDLVLGHRECIKGSTECTPDRFSSVRKFDLASGITGLDSYKGLLKGLGEKVGWQTDAASAVAAVVMQCKSGNGKPRGVAGRQTKSDTWLLFSGPDKVGKRKMAAALSELVVGSDPVVVSLSGGLGTDCYDNASCLGRRTALDRVAEAVRRNPFSLVVIDSIDRADMLEMGSIKRAIERGRLLDSQGREVSLGNAIFVLNSDWMPEELKNSYDQSLLQCEERILSSANCGWQLELSVIDRNGKRGAESPMSGEDRSTKTRKATPLSLDLNLAVAVDDDAGEASRNSSDLTVELGPQSRARLAVSCPAESPALELMALVDGAIDFKPVDFGPIRRKVVESISAKFSMVMGNVKLIRVEEDALDRIVGRVWLAGAVATGGFEEWADSVLVPSLEQLKSNLKMIDGLALVCLSAVEDVRRQWTASSWLPATVAIAATEQ